MANKPLTMLQIRRLLQLLLEERPLREIQRITTIHRTTIKGYVQRCLQSGKTYDELKTLD